MHVLIVKTSSLGDVLHTLPALTDAGNVLPGIKFDWVVEEAFQEIPQWHPLVDKVIPIALRRWRKNWRTNLFSEEFRQFIKNLRERRYDLIIDAQGLVKSALVARLARGIRAGLDKQSIWEPIARFAYQKTYPVNPELHAITRVRQLFAQALGYPFTDSTPGYGLPREQFIPDSATEPYLMFLHGTTWVTKHWPENYWLQLAKLVENYGLKVRMPWGNSAEKERAERIAQACSAVTVLPRMNLQNIAREIVGAQAAVAVDTGLGHLAAALNVPTISLYGPTDPKKIGTAGAHQIHLAANFSCAPCERTQCTYTDLTAETPACFTSLPPTLVWEKLQELL